MPKNIGVLFVASEADPFIRAGTLADLAGNLPKSIKNSGHDIRVVMPGYGSISGRRFQIHNLLRMKDISIPVGSLVEHAHVRSSYLNGETQKVLVYFLSNERYFNREGLYTNPSTKKYFTDNDERFIFFCRGVLEILKRLRWQPNVIHCNDWQSGLIPAYLKTVYKNDPFFKNVKTVFSVHSPASHGTFPKSSVIKTGIPAEAFRDPGSVSSAGSANPDGRLNFVRLGMEYADVVTTNGAKAEKGIRQSIDSDVGMAAFERKNFIPLTADHTRASGIESLARQFMDIYTSLIKNG